MLHDMADAAEVPACFVHFQRPSLHSPCRQGRVCVGGWWYSDEHFVEIGLLGLPLSTVASITLPGCITFLSTVI